MSLDLSYCSVTDCSFFNLFKSSDLSEFLASNATIGESLFLFLPSVEEDLNTWSSFSIWPTNWMSFIDWWSDLLLYYDMSSGKPGVPHSSVFLFLCFIICAVVVLNFLLIITLINSALVYSLPQQLLPLNFLTRLPSNNTEHFPFNNLFDI